MRARLREAFSVAGYASMVLAIMVLPAAAADAALQTDFLSKLDPTAVGGIAGFAGGTIRAMRSDVPTGRALAVDAVPGALAGGFAWPLTLTIFGPVLSTLQTTTQVVLTMGTKVGVAGLLTGVCLSVFIGAAESIFEAFRRKRSGK